MNLNSKFLRKYNVGLNYIRIWSIYKSNGCQIDKSFIDFLLQMVIC